MLVLSRKKNESVYVNGNIRVVIVDVRGDKVQLGIEAPSNVSVFRSEVLEKMQNAERRDEETDNVVTLDMNSERTTVSSESSAAEKSASDSPRRRGGARKAREARGDAR